MIVAKGWSKDFIPFKSGDPIKNVHLTLIDGNLMSHLQLVFLQQEKPHENETCWIMFLNYLSESTDIYLNWAIWFLSVGSS